MFTENGIGDVLSVNKGFIYKINNSVGVAKNKLTVYESRAVLHGYQFLVEYPDSLE